MQNLGIININEKAEKTPGCIRFDKGSGKFPFPKEFLPYFENVKEKIKDKYFHYPKTGGEPALQEQVIKLEKGNGRTVSSENITITHGGMSGLFAVLNCLTEPGDEVVTNNFCFEGFSLLSEHFKLVQKRADLSNYEEVKNDITERTKVIILNSPENPTGKVYSEKEISSLVELAEKNSLWLLSDEVINRIIYGNVKWYGPSINSDRVVIVNSFSKNWFIPGIRLGWIASRNKAIVKDFDNFFSMQSVGVNLFSQIFMAEVIKDIGYDKFLTERLEVLTKRKEIAEKLLQANNISYLQKVEGGMNFYVDLRRDGQQASSELLEKGVALIPGYLFEGKPSTFVRLGFGAVDEQDIVAGIETVSRFLGRFF